MTPESEAITDMISSVLREMKSPDHKITFINDTAKEYRDSTTSSGVDAIVKRVRKLGPQATEILLKHTSKTFVETLDSVEIAFDGSKHANVQDFNNHANTTVENMKQMVVSHKQLGDESKKQSQHLDKQRGELFEEAIDDSFVTKHVKKGLRALKKPVNNLVERGKNLLTKGKDMLANNAKKLRKEIETKVKDAYDKSSWFKNDVFKKMLSWLKKLIGIIFDFIKWIGGLLISVIKFTVHSILDYSGISYAVLGAAALMKRALVCNDYSSIMQEAMKVQGTNVLLELSSNVPFGRAIVSGMKSSMGLYSLSQIDMTVRLYDSLPWPLSYLGGLIDIIRDFISGVVSEYCELSWASFAMLCGAIGVLVQNKMEPKDVKRYEQKFYCFKYLYQLCGPC